MCSYSDRNIGSLYGDIIEADPVQIIDVSENHIIAPPAYELSGGVFYVPKKSAWRYGGPVSRIGAVDWMLVGV